MTTTVRRYDAGTLRAPVRTPEGFLKAEGYAARTGVLSYRRADGTTLREYVSPEVAFDAASLATLAMMPVTNQHPSGLLDARNAKGAIVGSVGQDVRRDGDYIAAPLAIYDADAIAALEAGRSQLSCGYECEVDHTPGTTPSGERYDAVQKSRRYNHLALVDAARAGSGARVRLDSGDAVAVETTATEKPMSKIRIDGLELDASEANALAIQQAHDKVAQRIDAADAAKKAAEVERDTAKAQADAEKLRADAAEKALVDAKAALPAAVRERVALEVEARKHLGAEAKLDELDNLAVKRAVVEKLDGDKLDGQSDAYVQGRFDAAIKQAAKAAPAPIDLARGAAPVRVDAMDPDAARAAYIAKQQTAHKPAAK